MNIKYQYYTCDKCGKTKEFKEIDYIGPTDREITSCSPFMQLLVICKKCNESESKSSK